MEQPASPQPRVQAKKPYVTPRVLQVERRADGDNLAAGCKVSGESAVGLSCLAGQCFNTGS